VRVRRCSSHGARQLGDTGISAAADETQQTIAFQAGVRTAVYSLSVHSNRRVGEHVGNPEMLRVGTPKTVVLRAGGIVLAMVAVLAALLVPRIREAREQARQRVHVTLFGQGSGGRMSYCLQASGLNIAAVPESNFGAVLESAVSSISAHAEGEFRPRFVTLAIEADALPLGALAPLEGCTRGLDMLSLDEVRLPADGLSHVKKMTSLKFMSLRNTGVSASSLEELSGLKALESLDVRGNGLSSESIRELQRLLPSCLILH
jgi:hypothetical protein